MQVNSSTVLVIVMIQEEPSVTPNTYILARPCPRVSSHGRLLKPTPKLLPMPNATDTPAGEGTFGSK